MTNLFERDLLDGTLTAVLTRPDGSITLLGRTVAALNLRADLIARGMADRTIGPIEPEDLGASAEAGTCGVLVICEDSGKEALLRTARDVYNDVDRRPTVVLAGADHLRFSDELFSTLNAPALVPSYATGYENTRVHMFQCLRAAASAGLDGAIVEFGAFKGGTTAWLVKVARALGLGGPVIAFDSWAGFPPPRSLLDLYAHPRCVFSEFEQVRAFLEPLGVELVRGDIAETAKARLRSVPILLAFVDTDNYSPSRAALEAIIPNLVVGGSVVLDHFHTTPEYVSTIGERMAATEVLGATPGLLQLHGTGVFTRLR